MKLAAQFIPHQQRQAEDRDQYRSIDPSTTQEQAEVVTEKGTQSFSPSPPEAKGSVRTLEQLWGGELAKQHGVKAAPFTGRDWGNMKDLLTRYGAQTLNSLIPWAIRFWKTVQTAGYFYNLPPTPVFTSFYANRDKFISAKTEYDARQEQERKEAEKTREWLEQPVVKPQKSLMEMFEEERRKLREARAAA